MATFLAVALGALGALGPAYVQYPVPITVAALTTIACAVRGRIPVAVGFASYVVMWLLTRESIGDWLSVPALGIAVAAIAWLLLTLVERTVSESTTPGRLFLAAAGPLLVLSFLAAGAVLWLRWHGLLPASEDPVDWQVGLAVAGLVIALGVAGALWALRCGWDSGEGVWRTPTLAFLLAAVTALIVAGTIVIWQSSTTARLGDAATTIAATMQTKVGDDQSAYAGRLSTAPRQPWDSEAAFALGNEPLLIGNPPFSVIGLLTPSGAGVELKYQINRVPEEAEPPTGWGELLGANAADAATVLSTTEVGPLLLGVREVPGAQGVTEPSVVYVGPQTVPEGSPSQFLSAAVSLATELDQSILAAGPDASLMQISLSESGADGSVGQSLLVRGPAVVDNGYVAASAEAVTIGDTSFIVTAAEAEGLGLSERERWLLIAGEVLLGLIIIAIALLAANARFRILRQLEEREALLAAAIDAAPGLVMLINRDREIVMANSSSVERQSTLVGRSVFDGMQFELSTDERAKLEANISAALAGESNSLECTDVGASDTLRIHEIATTPVPSRMGVSAAALVQVLDVTGSRWQAMRDAQSERLEALGAMAGGLAHDFNNLLFIINGYIQLMQADKRIQDEPDLQRYVEHAGDAAERGTEIAKSLLSVTRSQPLQATALSVNTFLQGMVPLVRQALGSDITLDLRIEEGALDVVVDAGQLSSSVLNLVINARDALGRQGSVLLAARRMYVADSDEIGLSAGDYIAIDVTDDGPGMAPEVEIRAFEPFFTTKPVGQGSGLGLASVYSFARQSGGTALIRSRVGEGTTVSILIPGVAGGTARLMPTSASGGTVSRVLVVDDEQSLAGLVAGWIADRGVDVRVASSMDEALLTANEFEPDTLLTDMNIGTDVDGLDVAARITLILPDIDVVFMTGFSDRMQELHDRGMRTLPKPFGRQDLYRVLFAQDGGVELRVGTSEGVGDALA